MILVKHPWVIVFLVQNLLQPLSDFAITTRDDVPDSSYVALGASLDYVSVGTVSSRLTGSGILIAPDWVLTAAHNIIASSSGSFTINGTTYTADELLRDPNYQPSNEFAGHDFGLMHLSTSVTAIPPMALYTGFVDSGQIGTFVGFGFTGTGLTGYRTIDGQKRAFQDYIDQDFGDPSAVLGTFFDNPHTSTNVLPLEGCAAFGDSGGGVFLSDGSQSYLAGVISFVASTNGPSNSSYGNFTGFDTISSALPWITSVVPEPATYTLLMLGLFTIRVWGHKRSIN
jgi:hypothetical protein